MKQVAIVSGKGGTGKTTFAAVVHAVEGGVIADCDVDAPNLHILLQPEILKREDFIAGEKAFIVAERCTACGLCYELCRFKAIVDYRVDERRCEGCAFCFNACPERAIEMRRVKTGEIYTSKTKYGYMVHAKLKPGEENSGKLASEVRGRAENLAKENDVEFVVIDSPPGVGCPVMASLTGVDAAIVISEPTMSGLSDLTRVIELVEHFKIQAFVVVNRYDLNESMTLEIKKWCAESDVEFVGSIPFDDDLVKQMSTLRFPFKGKAASKIVEVWDNVKDNL